VTGCFFYPSAKADGNDILFFIIVVGFSQRAISNTPPAGLRFHFPFLPEQDKHRKEWWARDARWFL
jgi:hypothetical protein